MQQLHKFSQQEHLRLQQKYNSLTARAEADTKGTRELLFRLSNVEEELPKFKAALAQYKEESRQLHDNNSRLSQELEHRRVKCEALSLQLRTTLDANELPRQALDEANKSLMETSKEVQLLKMQQADSVSAQSEERSKPVVLPPLTHISSDPSQGKRAFFVGSPRHPQGYTPGED